MMMNVFFFVREREMNGKKKTDSDSADDSGGSIILHDKFITSEDKMAF